MKSSVSIKDINEITSAIHKKTPNNLDPINTKTVPKEIRPLVNELNKLFLRLQETFQREKRFTANAAHELKTPLAALKTHAQVALNATQENERNLALQNIIQSVDRSNHVVQQLLTLNRMIPETMLHETKPVNIKIEAIQVISDLIPTARKEHIEIELDAPKAKPVVMGNIAAIDILLRNLIENAIIYTPKNGTVKVAIEISATTIVLRVTDNGPGIPEKLRKRVFERFFRIPGSGATGSGLGLNIAQQIAHIHNAKIELATPKSGKGLEVNVVFPKT